MAAAFNLTAQINLRGPANIKPIVSKIQKDINNAKIKLNLDVNQNAAKSITSITTRLNNLSKAAISANTNISNLNISLGAMVASLNNINSAATANVNSMAQTSRAVSSAGKSISQTRTQIEEFGKQAGLAVKRFVAFSAVTAPIYALSNAITSAFKEFVNFNKEMVRLSQVTGQSISDLSSFSKEITRLSTGLGVASSDLLTVATTLAQAGLSAEDTKIALEALAKSALAPSFESLTATTEGAIAALRQFGLQATDLDGALGSINAVAAAFAVEAGDIITAIQRTGGVFASASRGVSEGSDALNEFIAIFTSVRATTRESAETIATGLRTIFTRIQRTKTIEQLREFGIELQDLEGKFVGPFEATKRLSEGLSRIDPRTAEFATISEELGGFRQIGKVIPLIQQFATAQQALSVAQKGQGSLAKDAAIAQQSLAIQFEKTRQNFLALVREIGDSTSFKAFVGVSLTLANAFINLSRALKPLLPLLLTFASIKAGGAVRELGGGFAGVFGFGGGNKGGGGGAGTPPTGGPSGRGGGGAATAAIVGNTNILNTVSQALMSLNTSILALNQNIVNTNSLLLNRPVRGFATGGLVPGSGNSDTFRANLTPGEFVIRKSAVQAIGVENLAKMNSGGEVQRFMAGSPGGVRVPSGKGRGKKVKRGARARFDLPQPGDKDYLEWVRQIYAEYDADPSLPKIRVNGIPTPPEIAYADALITKEVFERGGSGMMLGYDAKGNEVIGKFGTPKAKKSGKLKKTTLGLLISAAGMKRGDRAPAGEMKKILGGYEKDPEYLKAIGKSGGTDSTSLLNILKAPLSAFRQSGGQTSLAGAFPGKSIANIRAAIPQYIALLGSNEPQKVAKAKTAQQYFDSFVGGGTAAKPGHATHFVETINQILKTGLVKEFASGGLVQRFKKGSTGKGVPVPPKDTDTDILRSIFGNDMVDKNGDIIAPNPMVIKQGPNKGESRPRTVTANDIRKNSKNLLNSGLDITKIKQAQDALAKKSIAVSEAKQALQAQALLGKQQAVTEDITRGQQGLANKIMTFGLVGLRYGSGAKGASSLDTFSIEVPPAFSSKDYQNIRGINVGTADKPQQQFIKIITSTISSQLGEDYARQLQKMLYAGFESSVVDIAKSLSSKSGLGASVSDNASLIQNSIENAGFYNVVGAGLESALNLLGTPFTAKDEDTKSIDFPTGLKSASKIFGSAFTNIPTDVTRTIGPGGKDATKFIAQIERYFKTPMGQANLALSRFAMGGSVSEEDTVPALLTPGEFVFNKKAAKRIGYGNLNRLNKADKVQGFNKGGVVGPQKFAAGGIVDNIGGGAGAIAAITAVILPEMEKLAASFQKLGGESSSLAAGLSGAAKEASSLVLSAGIALKTLGADKRTTGFTQVGVGIAGGFSGFITEKSAKDLEKALLKTSDNFGKFDKTLQDLTQAPTEELRIQAAADLEKTFTKLHSAVTNSVSSIDSLERAKAVGESINNLSLSVITGIAAMSALKTATEGMTFAAQRQIVMANRAAAAGAVGPAIGIGTKFLATFGKFIPYIGLAITAFSVVSEVVGYFTNTLKKSGEQLNKLYNALDETTKNSNAYNLANQNFLKNILPEFRTLRGTTDPQQIRERLGSLRTDTGDLNELNLTFKTLLRTKFAEQGIKFSEEKNLSDFKAYVLQSANGLNIFNEVIDSSIKEFEKEQFIRAKLASDPDINRDTAVAEFNRLVAAGQVGRIEIERTYKQFVGTKVLEILSLKDLTDANNRVKTSLVNLDNILVSLSSKISVSINKAINSFDDLDLKISTLRGEPEQIGGSFLRRDISVLENIGGATKEQVDSVTDVVKGLIRLPGQKNSDAVKRFGEISTQVQAVRVFQQDLPVILREIQVSSQSGGGTGLEKIAEQLDTRLGEQLRTIAGPGNESAAKTIITEASAQILKSIKGEGEAITNFDDLARNAPALAAALKNGEASINTFKSVLEASAKLQDKLGEQQKRLIDLNNELNQSITQRTQTELQNAIELKRLFGENISLDELNNVFESGIKQLTNVGGTIRSGGTTDVDAISAQLKKSKEYIQTLDEQIALTRNDQEITKDLTDERTTEAIIVHRLSQALKTLATSTDTTKNAFDKIAESQNKFKSQRDIFFDFVRNSRNPEAALEQRRIMDSIRAATAPGGPRFRDIEQALLFQEKGAAILKGFRPEANVEALLDATARSITGQTPAFNLFDRISKAYLELFFTQRGRVPRLEQKLKESQQTQKQAAQADEGNITEKIGVVTNTTSDIFNSFNIDLASILPGIIMNLKTLSDQQRQTTTTTRPEFLAPPGSKDTLTNLLTSIADIARVPSGRVNIGFGMGFATSTTPLLNTEEINQLTKEFGLDPLKGLQQINDLLSKKISAVRGPELEKALISLQNFQKTINDLYLQNQEIGGTSATSRSRFFNQPKQQAPIQNRAPLNDGASIQRFENSANNLSKSLSDAPLQNLSDSLGSFNTTATQLVSALKDFTSKFQDGMKGEISYTGDIGLNFNEPLAVNIPNATANRNNLISDLDKKLIPTIRSVVRSEIEKA